MHMNSLAPISITGTPGSLWKCGTIASAMVRKMSLSSLRPAMRCRAVHYPLPKPCRVVKKPQSAAYLQRRDSQTMRRSRLIAIVRSRCHPALPLVAALFLAPATFFSAQACLEARARLAADDPVQITDQALDHVLTAQV